ncbi:histidine phosphatase family protein [Jeotgalibacillus salarius]|uniref:Histidine phosphatase family protein n=1 Tax=Jeotgalibacillus salarius TaxID=546023 RepID=A0A4Y8LFG9_9BACL|nr:histidine phosphatase family protein [Jeotgalibacillus salarius]TFE01522.1 histidine phosphatase family protein [Jeotgalibacillus salarius]
MTNIYLVRHAHSVYTTDEHSRPLSEKGLGDAAEVTKILKSENIHVVISSPYKRAIQTVEGIAAYIEKEVEIVEDFRERALTDEPAEDFTKAITRVWEDFNFSWDGGESNVAAQERGVQALFDVLERFEGQNIVIGAHGNIMVLIMNYFDQVYDFAFWKELAMPDIHKLSFEERALKWVERIGGFE